MSSIRDNRQAVLERIQQLTHLHAAALANVHPERRELLVPVPTVAAFAFRHPRFARRLLRRAMRVFGLPPLASLPAELTTLLACTSDELENLVIHVGLLMILAQLPRVMQRGDIDTLKGIFGESAVEFAMSNRHLAPPSSLRTIRMPEAQAIRQQAMQSGWLALLHWARQEQGQAARWLEIRLSSEICNRPVPSSFNGVCREPVEKAIAYVFAPRRDDDGRTSSDNLQTKAQL